MLLMKKAQDITVGESLLIGAVVGVITCLPLIVGMITDWWSNR